MKPFYKRATLTAAAGTLLAGGLTLLPVANTHAADKYDTDLERRVETLERELNIMEGDKKGQKRRRHRSAHLPQSRQQGRQGTGDHR